MRSIITWLLRILGAGVVLVVVGFAFMLFQFNRPPFDLALLDRLRVGMTQDQVRSILGKAQLEEDGSWHYHRMMAWPIVHVYFDTDDKFKSCSYDY